MSTLLVDGDIVAYQIAFRTEQPIRWDNELWTIHSDEKECKGLIDEYFSSAKLECAKVFSFNEISSGLNILLKCHHALSKI